MTLFFISSIILLLGILVISLTKPQLSNGWKAALAAAGCLFLISASAFLFKQLLAQQIAFVSPWCFLLLLVPCAIFVGKTLFRRVFTRAIPFPLTHLEIEQASFRILLTRFLPLSLYMLALLLMIIALARPVQLGRTVLPPSEGIDIILLLDTSTSMDTPDFYPTRFIAAQQTAKQFIEKRPTDRLGLVVFASYAMLQSPLTLDHEALMEYIDTIAPGMVGQSTAIGDALGTAVHHLQNSKAKSKLIILLTDGDSNSGTIAPVLAAKAAASLGIRVYTIGTAREPSAAQRDELNKDLLVEIAQLTNGKFYRANDEIELAKIYDEINQLEKTQFAPATLIHRTDVYHLFLEVALGLLLLGLVVEKIFLIKVP